MYEYTFTRRRIGETVTNVSSAAEVVRAIGPAFDGAEQEMLMVAAVDTRNNLLGYEVVYRGNVSAALVRMGELFKFAVRLMAPRIILIHNHPSGDPQPSPDDRYLTEEAIKAGKILDIDVLDHVILGDWGRHLSMREEHHEMFTRLPR